MRRIRIFLALLLLCSCLVFSVSAATAAKSVSSYTTVSADGTCQVTLTANIHLDQPVEDLRFPLPGTAGNITVNGSRAHGGVSNGLRHIDISGIIGKTAGDFTLTFVYSLPNIVVTNDAGLLELQLPLLAGFAYPIQALEFSVTLPGPVDAKPAFSSGYHQANIEKDIYCTVSGATIFGSSQTELKDHETLTMRLLVSESMFPQNRIAPPDFQELNSYITIFSLIALVYWILFLRNFPTWPTSTPAPPDGFIAGQLSSVLHLQGGDLSTMVFSWAQLGYLLMHLERDGNVVLYKQMDMGNERSAFEQRCFKQLFGKRSAVDTGSLHYVQVYRTVKKTKPNLSFFIHRRSGNPYIFRCLATVAGMFCGISVGISLSSSAALQWFLVILIGALSLLSCWYIQSWATMLLSPKKQRIWYVLAVCALWLLLSILANRLSLGLNLVLGQLLAGILIALGGRRTPEGRQAMGEVLGFWRYLATVSQEQLQFISQSNPDYFHQMAPYALALGVENRFARQFGKLPIGPCPYIYIGVDNILRATQWMDLMRRILRAMNARHQNSMLEKLATFLQLFMK